MCGTRLCLKAQWPHDGSQRARVRGVDPKPCLKTTARIGNEAIGPFAAQRSRHRIGPPGASRWLAGSIRPGQRHRSYHPGRFCVVVGSLGIQTEPSYALVPYLLHTGMASGMVASGVALATGLLTGAGSGGRESERIGHQAMAGSANRVKRAPRHALSRARPIVQGRANPCRCWPENETPREHDLSGHSVNWLVAAFRDAKSTSPFATLFISALTLSWRAKIC
jgi:hypothetical protein